MMKVEADQLDLHPTKGRSRSHPEDRVITRRPAHRARSKG